MTLIEILESRKEALDVHQVAELLGVSGKQIYRLAAAGRLPAFRVGKAVRFDAQDLADWLREKQFLDEQPSSRKPQRGRGLGADRNGPGDGSSDRMWRGRVKSLEAALAISE